MVPQARPSTLLALFVYSAGHETNDEWHRPGMKGAIFGWDIGGAHLKLAILDADGRLLGVRQLACPLWQGLAQLEQACAQLDVATMAPQALHAVTMTGELCDVFPDRKHGVRGILDCLTAVLDTRATLRVYAGDAGWLSTPAAAEAATAVASANWLALATLVARIVADAVLLDIGSTTSDVILLEHGKVRCQGRDDAARLTCGELVYSGVVRTPVMAICRQVPVQGRWQNLTAEYFATMADVYRLLGQLDEAHDQMPSADGRSKDIEGSARRLARMLGRDFGLDASLADVQGVARYLARVQAREIEDAVALQASRVADANAALPVIGAGAGCFVAAQVAQLQGRAFQPFQALLEPDLHPALAAQAALAAPAVAVAKLAWLAR
jgi:probable H4MPT-linked C1 transfer pathway protein